MNSVDDLTPECLGYAGLIYESVLVWYQILSSSFLFHFNPVFIFHNLQIEQCEAIENAMFLFYREKISLLLSSSARTHCQLLCWWKAPTSTLWPKSKMLSGMALGLSKMPLKTVSYNGKMCLTLKLIPLKRLFQLWNLTCNLKIVCCLALEHLR